MKTALVLRGGWPGHVPVAASDRYVGGLRSLGYEVAVSDSLDSYLDAELLAGTDLVVQCWTMGSISAAQVEGLTAAVRAGTGFAGWHGGIVDSFRDETRYQLMTGGQFVYHPAEFVEYSVRTGGSSFTVHTEQYYVHTDPAIEVHAVTEFVEDGTTLPVTWTRKWGSGRVFVTTIGHKLDDFDVPEVDRMIIEGLTWASR
jgi:type 1 glutamine amidotransferase